MIEKKKSKDEEFQKEDFTDKYGTYKYLTQPQSDIKVDITSDFILAKLNENQKEAIIELVRDAYFAKKTIEKLAEGWVYKVGKDRKYIRNEDMTYKRYPLPPDERKYIQQLAKITFNSYMIKLIMTVIMYRNIEQNILMELITEKDRLNQETEELKRENQELGKRIKENVKKGEKE